MLIIVFTINPLLINQQSDCSIKEENIESSECCCCSDSKKCCCQEESPDVNKSFDKTCSCRINEQEPAEEKKEPLNLNLNFQKLVSLIKSDLLFLNTGFYNKENRDYITLKKSPAPLTADIYIETSNLRI